MKKNNKILFITAEYSDTSCGGAGVYAYELTKFLSKHEISVHVLTAGEKKKIIKINKNLIIEYVPTIMKPVLRTPIFWLNIRKAVNIITHGKNISLIHCNGTAAAFVSSSIPIITTIHHPAKIDNQNYLFFQKMLNCVDIIFEKRLASISQYIVATSEQSKKLIENIYPKHKNKIKLIPIGIDMDFFKKTSKKIISLHDLYKIPHDKFIIFYPGGARGRRKGMEYFLPAFKKFDSKKIHCIISGISREQGWKRYLQKQINSYNLKKNITLCGEIAYKNLPKYYSNANLVVFPSIFEGYGLPSIEALACGTPIIASNTGNAKNIIKDDGNGYIIQPKNSEELFIALNKLIKNKQLLQKFSLTARKSVVSKYSWKSIVNQYKNIYKEVLYETR